MSKYDNIYMEVIRMILEKYQDTYTKFITKYEEIHVNPWHNITKEKLNQDMKNLAARLNSVEEFAGCTI